jgi:uncharacterized heparinase superfamily protein
VIGVPQLRAAARALGRTRGEASLWWNTVRWLEPKQLYGRLWFLARRPRVELGPAPPRRALGGAWVAPIARAPSLLGPERVTLLDETRELASARAWDDPEVPKLWRYHLHYFDDLTAWDASARADWHGALITRWLAENPPGHGTGWEPYPTSRRISSWIKWALAGGRLPAAASDSLAAQARWLVRRLEWHLLGNHLWANAKALVAAGCFFEGAEADRWLALGGRILLAELDEQVLADGGHFERSPMYHALALEDVLDLLNAGGAWPGRLPAPLAAKLARVAPEMLRWLVCMSHPDGEIALLNDSAFDVAPRAGELADYAERLGLALPAAPGPLEHLSASGYARAERGPFWLVADVGPLGPDYQPGHAHADNLSFELSAFGSRWLVDTGCSTYAPGPERSRQRGTAAHNTVLVDGRDSSEVWSSFRVARRARPRDVAVTTDGPLALIRGAHDGYARRGVLHRRELALGRNALVISDRLEGRFEHAESRLHLHPEVELEPLGAGRARLWRDGRALLLSAENTRIESSPSSWHPGFNRCAPSRVLIAPFSGHELRLRIEVA